MSKFNTEGEVEDQYLEHALHKQMIPEKCSECHREVEELTQDKRREEAEQADRAEVENYNNEEKNND